MTLLSITDQKWLLGPLLLPAARGQYKCFSLCSRRWFLFYCQYMFNLEAGNTVQTEDFKRSWYTSTTRDSPLCSGRHKVWQEEWCFVSLIRPDKLTVMARQRNFHRITVLPMQPLSRQVVVPATNSSKTTNCLCLCANQTNATRVLISELRNS